MGYIDDFDNAGRNKIPYDDTPISRNESQSTSGRKWSGSNKSAPVGGRAVILFLAFSLILNIGLCIATVYYILNGVQKNVYQNQNNITIVDDMSMAAANTAMSSTIRVASGGSGVSDELTYYNRTYNHGAGIIYKIDRENKIAYFITCHHVIKGEEDTVYVLLPNSLKPITPADGLKTVGYSSKYDIAVLSYEYKNHNDPVEECNGIFDNAEDPQYEESYFLAYGQAVYAVGDPLSGGISITGGLISRLNTMLTVEQNDFYTREIQFSAEINKGNSGGGLYNSKGEFIGLVNAKVSTTKPGGSTLIVSGMAYALPGTFVISVARSIISEFSHKAVCIDLGVSFGHDDNTPISQVVYDNKFVSQYGVIVNTAGLNKGLQKFDIVKSFTYTDRAGIVHENVPMFNQYVFEDISFDIKRGSDIIFKVTRPATRTEETIVVKATQTKTIS